VNSIAFGKKCRPFNLKYKEKFGYVPCRNDYLGNQAKYFNALVSAVENNIELSEYIAKKKADTGVYSPEYIDKIRKQMAHSVSHLQDWVLKKVYKIKEILLWEYF